MFSVRQLVHSVSELLFIIIITCAALLCVACCHTGCFIDHCFQVLRARYLRHNNNFCWLKFIEVADVRICVTVANKLNFTYFSHFSTYIAAAKLKPVRAHILYQSLLYLRQARPNFSHLQSSPLAKTTESAMYL